MGPESSFVVEGPLRPAPFPRGKQQYPPPEKRLVAYLALSAVAPVPSTDPTRPGVPLWYYNVSAHDKSMEKSLQQQGLTEEQILERSVLFSIIGPDALGIGKAAHHKALELGWQPVARDPAQSPDPSGVGWRPYAETQRRPRPNQPVPVDVVIQHLMTVRTKLFSGRVPGWLLAWDDRGNPHQPCGLVYGMRGLAVGEPCGRTTGCVVAGGGACAWSRQALTDSAKGRPVREVIATEHLIEPIQPAYASTTTVPRGLVGAPPQQPFSSQGYNEQEAFRLQQEAQRRQYEAQQRALQQPHPLQPHPHPQQPHLQQPHLQQPQGRPLEWQPMSQHAAGNTGVLGSAPTNGGGGISWPTPTPPAPAQQPHPPALAPVAAPPVWAPPVAAPVPPPAVAPVPAPPVAPAVAPDPTFKPADPYLVAPAPPLSWEG